MTAARAHRWLRWLAILLAGWLLGGGLAVTCATAEPLDLGGRWFEGEGSAPVERIRATGGVFRYEGGFDVAQAGAYVIDFKNSSVIGLFEHRLYDSRGMLVWRAGGGIQSEEPNPFFMRHGRELSLAPGHYRLVSRLDSPFYLAQPEPYLDTHDHYRQVIKRGNALVLLCLGVFVGLGLYYSCLALVRRRRAEAMYAAFILGNLLYNSTALLVLRELFGVGWFYLISVPILLSNIAYIAFVVSLLDIQPETDPWLYRASRLLMSLFTGFVLLAAIKPNWSLELDRIGVGLFLLFGLSAGIWRTLRRDRLAPLYLAANVGFFITGITAISMVSMHGVYTLYIEHIGLMAVAIEVLLLALVLTHQFGLLEEDKARALSRAEHSLRLACTDALTGLPNRYALELELAELPGHGSLTYIDLDGLKYYNDRFGHARGDQLLRDFAAALAERLGDRATAHRHGGDEFAVTTRDGAVDFVERVLGDCIDVLTLKGYEISGASFGTVRVNECSTSEQLKHLADSRMYEHKRRRRPHRDSSVQPDARLA
jgi:diguanylate cyclase (GGDEF)-like protein